MDRGILVDGRCATTLPDVYAAGDCAQGYDAVSGEKRMLPLWPNAVLQGETAGINMAGGRADYTQGIALNASGVFGRTPTAVTSTSNSSSVPLWSRAVFPRNAAALSFR